MNMNNVYCHKKSKDGNRYIIKLQMHNTHCEILIIKNKESLLGKVLQDKMKIMAKHLSEEYQLYCDNLMNYIKKTPSNISIDVTTDKFVITKQVGNLSEIFISADLERVNYDSYVLDLLAELVGCKDVYQDKIVEMNKFLEAKRIDRDNYREKLGDFMTEHKKSKQQMISSFLLLLNEKKKRIKFLADLLVRKNITRTAILEEVISDSQDSEDGYDTDEENNEKEVVSPTTINRKRHFSDDESLACTSKEFDLSDDDSPLVMPIPKRLKSENNIAQTTVRIVSDNRGDKALNQINNNKSVTEERVESKQPPVDIQEDSPTINFSTQDLFDRM